MALLTTRILTVFGFSIVTFPRRSFTLALALTRVMASGFFARHSLSLTQNMSTRLGTYLNTLALGSRLHFVGHEKA